MNSLSQSYIHTTEEAKGIKPKETREKKKRKQDRETGNVNEYAAEKLLLREAF